MRPHLTRPSRQPGRAGLFRCNLCQEPVDSDQALRDHYRQRHPEAAAALERARASLAGQDPKTH